MECIKKQVLKSELEQELQSQQQSQQTLRRQRPRRHSLSGGSKKRKSRSKGKQRRFNNIKCQFILHVITLHLMMGLRKMNVKKHKRY